MAPSADSPSSDSPTLRSSIIPPLLPTFPIFLNLMDNVYTIVTENITQVLNLQQCYKVPQLRQPLIQIICPTGDVQYSESLLVTLSGLAVHNNHDSVIIS